jgi:hypothetical protein
MTDTRFLPMGTELFIAIWAVLDGMPGENVTIEQDKEFRRKAMSHLVKIMPTPDKFPAGGAPDEGHPHLIFGEFQSDKYPTTPRGKVPLSVKDKTAQDLLWVYAQRRRGIDKKFSEDLEIALKAQGYVQPAPRDQSAVDWSVVRDAIVDTCDEEGIGGAEALASSFKIHGLLVDHDDDPTLFSLPVMVMPPLNGDLAYILGAMIMHTCPLAHEYRNDGADIRAKTEAEQAFILHKMLTYYFADPVNWQKAWIADVKALLERRRAAVAATTMT